MGGLYHSPASGGCLCTRGWALGAGLLVRQRGALGTINRVPLKIRLANLCGKEGPHQFGEDGRGHL